MMRKKDRVQVVYTPREIERARLAKAFADAWRGERATLTILGNTIERERDDSDDSDSDDSA
jgi:hypothetical protein